MGRYNPWVKKGNAPKKQAPYLSIPVIDLNAETQRQVIVDKEKDQYLGHPTTVLLEDDQTILTVYPKGHGKGGIVYKKSEDGGKTWSKRLPTPKSWATSKEVPTIHRVIDKYGTKRLIMWSGLYPARLSVSEDDGQSWSELEKVGNWGGIVVMGALTPLETGKGHYAAKCAACHGQNGEGLIGPNLTDKYWIHSKGKAPGLLAAIRKGFPAKGMPPWEALIPKEDHVALAAYVYSLQGTNPEGGKEPQGELIE